MKPLTQSDIMTAARTVWGEGRGEDYAGQKAIAHVLINRWQSNEGQFRRDHTLAAAALRWLQFSTWNENDPNREAMQGVDLDDVDFRQCLRAVLEALDERDFTFDSKHYHTSSIRPDWAEGKEPVMAVGNHVFYNDVP